MPETQDHRDPRRPTVSPQLLLLCFLAGLYGPQIVLWVTSRQFAGQNVSERVMLLCVTPFIVITGLIERVAGVHGSSWSGIVGATLTFVALCWTAGSVARVRGRAAVALACGCEILLVLYSVWSWWIATSILWAG